jgi:rubrerythrin
MILHWPLERERGKNGTVFDLSVFSATFLIIFTAEMGDKSQLAAFSLSSTVKNPVAIFLASASALILASIAAALLGGLAANVAPWLTVYLSGGLFILFGLMILTSGEMPVLKECLIESIQLEKTALKTLPRVFKKAGKYDDNIINIMRQEKSHLEMFKFLMKEKAFFKKTHHLDEKLKPILEDLKQNAGFRRLPFHLALDKLVNIEEACIAFYEFLENYVKQSGMGDEVFKKTLVELIEEEKHHRDVFNSYRPKRKKNG